MLLFTLRKENLAEEENIILGGDFNCPLNPFLDKKSGILTQRKSVVKIIKSLQDEFDLVDIWRIRNPTKKVLRGARTLQWSFAIWNTG